MIQRRFLNIPLLLILLLNNNFVFGEKTPTFEYYDQSFYNLISNIEIVEDTTNKFTITDIILKDLFSNSFKSETNSLHINFSKSNYWLKFDIKNTNEYIKTLILEVSNSTVDKIQLYTRHQNMVQRTKITGDKLPFNTRLINSNNFVYKLILEPNETYTYYLLINSGGDVLNLPILIYSPTQFIKKTGEKHIIYGFFYGIVVLILLIMITSLILKYKIYAIGNYIFYIFFIGLFLLSFDGLAFQYFYPDLPWLTNKVIFFSPLIAFYFLLRFVIKYFNIKYYKKLYIALSLISYLNILAVPFTVFGFCSLKLIICFIFIIVCISISSIIITSIIFIKKYTKLATLFLFAFVSLFVAMIGIYASIFFDLSNLFFGEILIKSGLSVQFILLAIAMIINLKSLHEKAHNEALINLQALNKLKEKANIELENVVEERTKSLSISNEKFKKAIIQNSNITTKLHQQKSEMKKQHDEIGQKNIKLEIALGEINKINSMLKQKNEEIKTQRDKIEIQRDLIEKRNRDITDSILYAGRIQSSILPTKEIINNLLPNSFVFFKPKEVLSGDFYWMGQFIADNKQKKSISNISEYIIISAIDCTGHGVPGALMSIVAHDLLNKAIKERKYLSPSKILDELNRGIINTFHKDIKNRNISDGMDMSLITIEKETNKLQFAGAYNPLYLIRNNELNIIKGDKFSVGYLYKDKNISFTNQNIQLQKDDILYLFTDGFADQFGGPDDKKFKNKQFKQLLIDIHEKPLNEQEKILENTFNNWKKNMEQIDDVLVIGIRI